MAKAENMELYYRVPMDDRLNYDKFFVKGDTHESSLEDYTSQYN